jgi:hypothetical protein
MSSARRTRTRRGNVTVTETSMLPAMRQRLAALAQHEIRIGMEGDAEHAMIAAILEFGAPSVGIPSRPFVRNGAKRARAAITKMVKSGLQEIAVGSMRAETLQQDIGDLGLQRMEKAFDSMRKPPLTAIYAKRKGSKKLLVDERKLRESLTVKVIRR